MVYKFFKVLVSYLCKVYFRKIYISGLDNLPPEGPVFITSNHPDGFTEPLLLACFLPRELYFLVRGDVFENPFLKPLLIATNQIPIYRTKDGFSNLRNNSKTFSEVYKVLDKGNAILVFAEGSTKLVKRIRTIQKGTAKMAHKTLSKNSKLDLKIVPISLYYTEQVKFRSEVIISIGSPINPDNYFKNSDSDVQGVNDLTKEIEKRMNKLIPFVDDDEISLVEKHIALAYEGIEYKAFKTVEKTEKRIPAEQSFLKKIRIGETKSLNPRKLIYGDPVSLLLCIPAFAGWLFHLIPGYLTKWIADYLVHSIVFMNAIRMVVGLVLFIIYYIFIVILFKDSDLPLNWTWLCGIVCGIIYLLYDSHNYKSYLRHNNLN